jgi:CBS domain containing-hemolysin-like protein
MRLAEGLCSTIASMLVVVAVIIFLILVTALYVAAEFGAVGVRRSRLRRLAEDGNRLAARLLPVLEDGQALDRYIAVSQVGITLSSLILGAYGQATLAPRLTPLLVQIGAMDLVTAESSSALIVLLGLTAGHMVLGELVPKSVALQYPTETAIYTVLPMMWSLQVAKWAIDALNGSGILILRILRIPVTGHRHVHSPEEIELLIAESRDGGLLEPLEQVRLHRALRLGLRTARQLMVPRARLVGLDASTPIEEVFATVISSPYSRLPVYDGTIDKVVGILHIKDLVTAYVRGTRPSLTALLRTVVEVPENMAADKLLAFVKDKRSHQAIVRDERGAVAGLITLEDVLAELLGGVADEFKTTQIRAIKLPDGRVRVPGAMRLDQAAGLAGVSWAGSGDSVGAHVVQTLGRVPDIGEQVMVGSVPVEIEAADKASVLSLIIGRRRSPAKDSN